MGAVSTWISVVALFVSVFIYIHTIQLQKLTIKAAVYYAIWAIISWQLVFELWIMIQTIGQTFWCQSQILGWAGQIAVFVVGYFMIAVTIAKWMPDGGQKKIGPRQVGAAILTFIVFEIIALALGTTRVNLGEGHWLILYLSHLLLAVLLYLQSELFKKSEMRQDLEVMNLLWKKEQEQYLLSKENIALINQKCHDLKHQIRAIRSAKQEEIDQYLAEMEDSIQIYEAIVKTGNEVLDTILTEKSLYCKERGIMVSCVADGSQLHFVHTIDLYAILGNAIDNAIEAVEKIKHQDKRQIDVLIYRKQKFLVINVINPMLESLVYEEELPITTKEDKGSHGYGLKSVKHLVKKYGGFLTISEEDTCFSLMIVIPIPEST